MEIQGFEVLFTRRVQVAEYQPAECTVKLVGAAQAGDRLSELLPMAAEAARHVVMVTLRQENIDKSLLAVLDHGVKIVEAKGTENLRPSEKVEEEDDEDEAPAPRRRGRPRKTEAQPAPTPAPEAVASVAWSEPEAPKPEPEPVVVEEPKGDELDALFDAPKPKPQWNVPTLDDFRRQVLVLAQQLGAEGAEKVRAIRAQFGVDRIQDIPQARWTEFLDAIYALKG